ncbi:unnamed protein product [Lampetra planeri]
MEMSRPEHQEMAAVRASSPPLDTWSVLSDQLELLLQTVTQLAVTVAVMGERTRAPDTVFECEQQVPAFLAPASRNFPAILPTDATREMGAILNTPPQHAAIFSATLQLGAISAATLQPRAIADPTPQFSVTAALSATPSGVAVSAPSTVLTSSSQQLPRLPPVRPFIATGGNCLAFQDCFNPAYGSVG